MTDTPEVFHHIATNIVDLCIATTKLTEEVMCSQRPSTIFRPVIALDGNKWCALYGDNPQEGIAGFGDSPADAMVDFDKQWNTKIGDSHD